MLILITGVPGTGKTTISKGLKKVLKEKYIVVNDKDFCKLNNLGSYSKEKEYVVSLKKLNDQFKQYLLQNKQKNIIFEGHLWCELNKQNLNVFDFVFELVTDPKIIKKRLLKRKYFLLKIEDNIFCQETNYISNILERKHIFFYKVYVTNNKTKNISLLKKIIYGTTKN